MLTDTPDRGESLVAAGARAHRWFKLGSDHEKSDRGARVPLTIRVLLTQLLTAC